jgi:hypothetical protein
MSEKHKIITGANDNFILTLLSFIEHYKSIHLNLENLIIYDLGLNKDNLQKVIDVIEPDKTIIRTLDYNLYPEHVNLHIYYGMNCSYAFKPIAIYNEAQIFNNIPILWLDCACIINKETLKNMLHSIHTYGFYCPVGNEENTIESIELNHPRTIELLGLSKEEHHKHLQTRLALVCGVLYETNAGKEILDNWYHSCLKKDIVVPEGSSRNNHRQDQTVLSVLMHQYEKKHDIVFEKFNFNLSLWNKKDKPLDEDLTIFMLVERYDNMIKSTVKTKTFEEAVEIFRERKNMPIQYFFYLYYVYQY